MRLLSLLATSCAIATVATVAAVAPVAAPSASAADRAVTLSADDLGIGNHQALVGLAGHATIVVPAPHDLTPRHLTGSARLSLDGPDATLEFQIDNKDVKVLRLKSGESQSFDIALPVGKSPVVVGLKSLIGYAKTYCQGRLSVPEVDLDDLSVSFTASDQAPTSISTFLPAILKTANIWLPDVPTAGETGGAVELATGLTRLFGAQRVSVAIKSLGADPLPPNHAFDPLVRDFVVRSAATEGLNLVSSGTAPVLVIGGKDPQLQASLAVSELRRFASSDKAAATGLTPDAELPAREQLLIDHGLSSTAVSGTGEVSTTAHVTQSDFGGMTQKMVLRVSGSHTPLTGTSNVVVSLLANGKLIATKRSGSSGKFSFKTTVAEPVLQRDNDFTVVATERSPGGPCSVDVEPIDLQVNASSSVEATMGVSLPLGVVRTPQSLLPTADLAFTNRQISQVSAAVSVICALQRLSSQPLHFRVASSVASIATSKLPAFVVTDSGTKDIPVTLPVSVLSGQITAVDLEKREVRIAPDTPVLQIAAVGTRHVMVMSAGSALQLTTFARALTADVGTFPGFTGDAIVRDPDDVLHDIKVSAAASAPGYVPTESKIPLWAVGSIGLIALALLVALVVAWRKRRES